EVAKARLAVGSVVPHCLVEAEQAFLDQIIGLPPEQEVGRSLEAHEAAVAAHDRVVGVGSTFLGESDQVVIIKLSLRVSVTLGTASAAGRESHFLRRGRKSHRSFSLREGSWRRLPPLRRPYGLGLPQTQAEVHPCWRGSFTVRQSSVNPK